MQIYLLTTTACNLKCTYCIRGEKRREFLELQTLRDILQKNDFSNNQVLITGGEPTMHPEFEEIVKMCCNYFKSVSINTNGTNYEFINRLKSERIHLQISLDGNEYMHDLIRGNGTFRSAINNIRRFDQMQFDYNIATVVNLININNIIEMIDVLSDLKNMKYWKVEAQLPFGCGDNGNCVSVEEWNILVEKLLSLCPFRLVIKKLFDFSLISKLSDEQIKYIGENKTKNCGNCNSKIYVYPDFTVYPCTCLTDFPLGNLKEEKLSDILNSKNAKMFSCYEVNKNSQCSKCRYLPICNGGCIGMSYNNFGELGWGDVRCKYVQKDSKHHVL